MSGDEFTHRKTAAVEMNDVFLKAISAVRLNRKAHRCVFILMR